MSRRWDWNKAGEPHAEVKTSLSVAFEAINADEGSAVLVGSFGAVDIVSDCPTVCCIRAVVPRPLHATSIFPVASDSGRLLAVHAARIHRCARPGYTWRPSSFGTCVMIRRTACPDLPERLAIFSTSDSSDLAQHQCPSRPRPV